MKKDKIIVSSADSKYFFLLKELKVPISTESFRKVTHHNSHIPIYKIGEL